MTDQIEPGAHDIAWTGTTVRTGQPAPGVGTWEVVGHEGCWGNRALRELGRRDRVPQCPGCGAEVTWQLSHLAPNVAADHRSTGPLP